MHYNLQWQCVSSTNQAFTNVHTYELARLATALCIVVVVVLYALYECRLVVLSLRLKMQMKGSRRPQKTFDAQLCKEEDHWRDYIEAIWFKLDN